MSYKYTTDSFKEMLFKKFGNKYDLSKVIYVKSNQKIVLGCPIHGDFSVLANGAQQGRGCSKCAAHINAQKKKHVTKDFIEKANIATNNAYDLSECIYVDSKTKVTGKCRLHGKFKIIPGKLLEGKGCKKCGAERCGDKLRLTTEEFLSRVAKLETKYDYSLVEYKNNKTKVKIICPEHGVFSQLPFCHLNGRGCKNCAESGFRTDKPGYIYFLQSSNLIKVGITNRLPSTRLSEINKDSNENFRIIHYQYFEQGLLANQLERIALEELRSLYEPCDLKFPGYTECFKNVSEECFKSFINKTILNIATIGNNA